MRQRRFAIVEAAGFAVALAGAVTTVPASAAPLLAPNGSFDYNTPGTNSVNTGNGTVKLAESRLGRSRADRVDARDDNSSRPNLRRPSLPW
jgi:hypothetical protein